MEFNFSPAQGTAAGILAFVVIAIISGWLVPRWVVSSLNKAAERETQTYKSAYEKQLQVNATLVEQNMQLMEFGRAATQVFQALPTKTEKVL